MPMATPTSAGSISNTEHGLLVAFGEFFQQHGLLKQLMQVPVRQKASVFRPQTKLIEFLAGIMSGIEYLSDLNDGAHPVAKDAVVALAWTQQSFAHYSGVSRMLKACDQKSVDAVQQAIDVFSQPFISSAVHELLHAGLPVIYDLDLLGQAVSSTCSSYPHAAFGWMNDSVKLGYQLARVCFSTKHKERIWLSGFHHAGDRVSATCLQELIQTAEAQTQVRPRRRTDLLVQRMVAQTQKVQRSQRLLTEQETKHAQLQQTQTRLIGQLYHAAQVLKTPISTAKSARLTQQMRQWRERLLRLAQQLSHCQQVCLSHESRVRELQIESSALALWLQQLERDNQTNPDPPQCRARMDSGFSSGVNLTWLIEMGYQVDTKAPSDKTTNALRAALSAESVWTRVGDNAEMIAYEQALIHDCPFPLTLALERFKLGDTYAYATLIRYRADKAAHSLPSWFSEYNARQLIEAGNKELKSGAFHVQHLMSRSAAGIQIQVLFAGLCANTVHWSMPWLRQCAAQSTPKLIQVLKSPKHMIRVAANSSALVQQTLIGTSLQFAPTSALPGATLILKGIPAFQLALGFQQPFKNASGSTF
jgi:hypothetical protein